jgi:hypothetical protein
MGSGASKDGREPACVNDRGTSSTAAAPGCGGGPPSQDAERLRPPRGDRSRSVMGRRGRPVVLPAGPYRFGLLFRSTSGRGKQRASP